MSVDKKDAEIFETPDEPQADDKKQPVAPAEVKNKEDIIENNLRPQLAFEQFAGKVYEPVVPEFADAAAIYKLSGQSSEYASWRRGERGFETPLQRYQRLKDEITQFQKDLETLSKTTTSGGPIATLSSAVSKELVVLEQRLDGVHKHKANAPFFDAQMTDQAMVEQKTLFDKLMSQIQAATKGVDEKGQPTSQATAAKSLQERVTYELFYNPLKEKGRYEMQLSELDKRIAALEKTLGTFDPNKSMGYPDVHTALQNLQRRLEVLDTHKLDSIVKQIKTVTLELEELHRTKAKVVGGSDGKVSADGKATDEKTASLEQKINQVYEVVMQWDQAARQLPGVIARLQSLKDVHQQSAEITIRAQNFDREYSKLESLLQQDKLALDTAKTSLAKNVDVMQKNVQSLETRFQALAERMKKLKA